MTRTLFITAASLALVACTYQEAATSPQETGVGAAPAIEMPVLPTQDEEDAQAAQAITPQNADAEFEKLKKELSGG